MPIGEIVISSPPDSNSEHTCFICLEEESSHNPLIKPCLCRGTNSGVHKNCLEIWIEMSNKDYCMVCNHPYYYTQVYSPSCYRILEQFNYNKCYMTRRGIVFIPLIILLVSQILALTIVYGLFQELRLDILIAICFGVQILSVIFFQKIDKKLNRLTTIKYMQLVFSIIFYIYMSLRLHFENTSCEYKCYKYDKCTEKCPYYKTYQERYRNIYDTMIYQGIILGGVFLIDTFLKIKRGMYQPQLREMPILVLPIHDNQIYPTEP